jgi:K+-transporting ATPase KdpF subunit
VVREVPAMGLVLLILSLVVAGYLLYAMLRPEEF